MNEVEILRFACYRYPLSILLRESGSSTYYLYNSLMEDEACDYKLNWQYVIENEKKNKEKAW